MSTPEPAASPDDFGRLITPLLFGDAVESAHPRLNLALSAAASGRSRVTGRLENPGVVLNARDLEALAVGTGAATASDSAQVAARWLQRALTASRERRVDVTLEGTFRSPALVIGLAQLFADAGYETCLATVAERVAEVRMSDASRSFDIELRQRRPGGHVANAPVDSVAPLLAAVVDSRSVDRVMVFDRDGGVVVDADRDSPGYDSAPHAFSEAAARALGTLRSAEWLSELRHMSRFLAQQGPAPRWAVEELIALHQLALDEIVPGLAVPADSETRRLQEERLAGTLVALRKSVTSAVSEDRTASVEVPQVEGVGLSR